MAYPTKNFSALQSAFDAQVNAAKVTLEARRVEMAAGALPATSIVGVGRFAASFGAAIAAHKAQVANTSGFAAFVAADKGVTIGALSTAINALETAVAAVVTAAKAVPPVDGAGYLLIYQFNGGGAMVERKFTSAETANLRTAIAAAVAEVA